MQFFVQMLVDIAGVGDEGDGYAFIDRWFDTIDEAVEFVKEHNQGTLRLHSMQMFTGTKPEDN